MSNGIAQFNQAASTYNRHADPQREAAQRLLDALESIRPTRILEIGCGTGLFTQQLWQKFPGTPITAIDPAPNMIRFARQHCGPIPCVWKTTSVQSFRSATTFDLITGNASLHWAQPLAPTLQHIYRLTSPGGEAVFSIMLKGTLQELKICRTKVAAAKEPAADLPRNRTAHFRNQTNRLQKSNTRSQDPHHRVSYRTSILKGAT